MSGVIYAKRPKISGDVRELDTRFRTIDSTVNQLKVYMSGSGSVRMQKVEEYVDDKEIVDITHNLGYQPFFAGWFKLATGSEWKKIPSRITTLIGEEQETFFSAMGRPSDNILQLHFYTASIFGPMYDIYLDYKYIIYVDPYRDAW